MADIQEQTQLAVEIQDQISTGPIGADLDEVRYPLRIPRLIVNCEGSDLLFSGGLEERAGRP